MHKILNSFLTLIFSILYLSYYYINPHDRYNHQSPNPQTSIKIKKKTLLNSKNFNNHVNTALYPSNLGAPIPVLTFLNPTHIVFYSFSDPPSKTKINL